MMITIMIQWVHADRWMYFVIYFLRKICCEKFTLNVQCEEISVSDCGGSITFSLLLSRHSVGIHYIYFLVDSTSYVCMYVCTNDLAALAHCKVKLCTYLNIKYMHDAIKIPSIPSKSNLHSNFLSSKHILRRSLQKFFLLCEIIYKHRRWDVFIVPIGVIFLKHRRTLSFLLLLHWISKNI